MKPKVNVGHIGHVDVEYNGSAMLECGEYSSSTTKPKVLGGEQTFFDWYILDGGAIKGDGWDD